MKNRRLIASLLIIGMIFGTPLPTPPQARGNPAAAIAVLVVGGVVFYELNQLINTVFPPPDIVIFPALPLPPRPPRHGVVPPAGAIATAHVARSDCAAFDISAAGYTDDAGQLFTRLLVVQLSPAVTATAWVSAGDAVILYTSHGQPVYTNAPGEMVMRALAEDDELPPLAE